MEPYIHKVQYYETDRMQITHHSNYIRWMEEARIDYLSWIGCDYREMENRGILSPVLSVDCKYKHSTTFGDRIAIQVTIKEFRGVRLVLSYEMKNMADDTLVCTAMSEHCFLDKDYRPILLKKEHPDIHQLLIQSVSKEEKA